MKSFVNVLNSLHFPPPDIFPSTKVHASPRGHTLSQNLNTSERLIAPGRKKRENTRLFACLIVKKTLNKLAFNGVGGIIFLRRLRPRLRQASESRRPGFLPIL